MLLVPSIQMHLSMEMLHICSIFTPYNLCYFVLSAIQYPYLLSPIIPVNTSEVRPDQWPNCRAVSPVTSKSRDVRALASLRFSTSTLGLAPCSFDFNPCQSLPCPVCPVRDGVYRVRHCDGRVPFSSFCVSSSESSYSSVYYYSLPACGQGWHDGRRDF